MRPGHTYAHVHLWTAGARTTGDNMCYLYVPGTASIDSLRTPVNAAVARRTQPALKVTPSIRSHLAKRHRSDSPVIWRPTIQWFRPLTRIARSLGESQDGPMNALEAPPSGKGTIMGSNQSTEFWLMYHVTKT